jgi:hypothetical protein
MCHNALRSRLGGKGMYDEATSIKALISREEKTAIGIRVFSIIPLESRSGDEESS